MACGDPPTVATNDVPVESGVPAAVGNPHRPQLANAKAVTPGDSRLDVLSKVDLAHEQSSGNLTLETNDPQFAPRAPAILDGNVASMSRSEGVNPLILTLTLREPLSLAAARVYPAGSTYDWLLEPSPGGPRLMVENAADSAWSQIELSEPVSTSVIQLEILRRERDDYVHLTEIELYTKP